MAATRRSRHARYPRGRRRGLLRSYRKRDEGCQEHSARLIAIRMRGAADDGWDQVSGLNR